MGEQAAFVLWSFESQDFGCAVFSRVLRPRLLGALGSQISVSAGETVMIQDEQADGWSTVERKGGEMGFVPTAFLDKSKQKRKGTIFSGKKKGSSDPPVSVVPPFLLAFRA
jgi:hypothetical protein